eukprot:TRINITY_DN11186_c0_g1_i1.p1 TRINITY_DN11186_c0_g1~~TRINITY_DN11186_c0_g1_i1.p1  ORF type:complete len:294 (+),score=70.96 TRINITY_DN11186_c0_g1_i1:927-1808(+)
MNEPLISLLLKMKQSRKLILDDILQNKEEIIEFRRYLESRYSEEHIDFWIDAKEFLEDSGNASVDPLLSEYIKNDSHRPINISGDLRNKVITSSDDQERFASFLKDCVKEVEKMMWENFLSGFLDLRELEQSGALEGLYSDDEVKRDSEPYRRRKARSQTFDFASSAPEFIPLSTENEKSVQIKRSDRLFVSTPPRKRIKKMKIKQSASAGLLQVERSKSPDSPKIESSKIESPKRDFQKKDKEVIPTQENINPEDLHPTYLEFVYREIQKKNNMIMRRDQIKERSSPKNEHL